MSAHPGWQPAPARDALPLATRGALAALLSRHRVLIVPGWNNSGPAHWQSRWQAEFPSMQRVHQEDWAQPDPAAWTAMLDAAVRQSSRPAILVAHSLGCITVANWVRDHAARDGAWPVVGALLVAPADVEREDAPSPLRPFAPIARLPLPFVTRLVASNNDPACSEARARALAATWGAGVTLLDRGGHINADSGLGAWPYGLSLLAWLQGAAS